MHLKMQQLFLLGFKRFTVILLRLVNTEIRIIQKTHIAGLLCNWPWWCAGACSGCCRRWRASTCSPAGHIPAAESTSCPERTSHTQSWGRPSDTNHSSPSTHNTYTGALERGRQLHVRLWTYWNYLNLMLHPLQTRMLNF